MPRKVRELSDIEIDEVSLVDRPANQYAEVAIAKRAEGDTVPEEIFNEAGEQLDFDSLEEGQVVFDEEGNAYEAVVLDQEDLSDEEEDSAEEISEQEPELVGKGFMGGLARGFSRGAKMSPQATARVGGTTGAGVKTGQHLKRNRGAYVAGAGGAAAGAGAGYMSKSFADEIREELSKAASDRDRDEIITKALENLEIANAAALEATQIAKAERELRLGREYSEVAKGYNLPVDPDELGPVLMRMAETMDDADCAVIHKALTAAGEALFAEVGFIGGGDNAPDIMAEVEGHLSKSDSSLSADAIAKFFDANPDAYDEYLAGN